MNDGNETLRWPTNLDHPAIIQRLLQVRAMAQAAGLEELVARIEGVEQMPAAELGTHVISALNWIQEKPEHGAIISQLAMVAMNLKNLK
jgi:hypothetical protein